MFKIDCIEKVVWYDRFIMDISQRPHSDRLGVMVAFHLKDVPNRDYVAAKALAFLRNVFAIMGFDTHHVTEFGEQCECWVVEGMDENPVIYVKHKYWSREKFFLFKAVIEAATAFHGWEEEVVKEVA